MANTFKKGDIVKLRDNARELPNPFGWNSEMRKCIGHMFVVTASHTNDIKFDYYPNDPKPYIEKPSTINWAWHYSLFEHASEVSEFDVSSSDLSALLET